MTNDPHWYNSRRLISARIAGTLSERLISGSFVSRQDLQGAFFTIGEVNLSKSKELEMNRPGVYTELQRVGVSEEDIRAIPLFENYDHEAG